MSKSSTAAEDVHPDDFAYEKRKSAESDFEAKMLFGISKPPSVAIRSVSSGNYLNGRNPEHVGIQVHLTNRSPKGLKWLHWELYCVDKRIDCYTIRSVSSGLFMNGRDPRNKGRQVRLDNISVDKARSSKYFKWRITEFTYGGDTRVAIQSVSSGLYLDGRNPPHTGNQLHLTGRNPQGDKHLMWLII